MNRWARYNRARAYFNEGKIGDQIQHLETELDTAIDKFHIGSDIRQTHSAQQLLEIVTAIQFDLQQQSERHAEMQQQFAQVIANPNDVQTLVQIHNDGTPIGESVMERGQQVRRLTVRIYIQRLRQEMLATTRDAAARLTTRTIRDAARK